MVEKISSSALKQADKNNTQRAKYQALSDAGYSLRQIADAYGVNHRTVWERTHDRVYTPSEKPKKVRLRKTTRLRKGRMQKRR